jgi:hypothetical protein
VSVRISARARPGGSAGRWLPLAICLTCLLAGRASAYEEAVHALLDARALPTELLDIPLAHTTAADLVALRRALYRAGASDPDPAVRARFLARYPTEPRFDDWDLKDFLGLNPDLAIQGIDALPPFATAAAPTIRDVLTAAAREPDEDRRNQERFAHDEQRKVRRDRWNNPLPADPAQLDMGALHGLSSQAWAHYGLPHLQMSDSPDVLKKDPRRFAYPPTARGFAADFAQEFTDLAVCAATLGTEGGPLLGWLYLGNAHHYIEDVANQIHTLQAVYGFFFDAKIESYKEELRSLGGLLRSRSDFVSIGIGIIKNHHVLIERLWAKRILEAQSGNRVPAEVADGLAAIDRGDGALEQAFDARQVGPGGEFGRMIAEEVIEASSREGAEVYELMRSLARRSLSRLGNDFDDTMDPDAYLRPDADAEKLPRFYRLEAAGFARAGSALRRHVRLYRVLLDQAKRDDAARQAVFDASARRLVRAQLDALDAREARLAKWTPSPPRKETVNWLVPGGLLVALMLFILLPSWLVVRRIRRRRRRSLHAAQTAARHD